MANLWQGALAKVAESDPEIDILADIDQEERPEEVATPIATRMTDTTGERMPGLLRKAKKSGNNANIMH